MHNKVGFSFIEFLTVLFFVTVIFGTVISIAQGIAVARERETAAYEAYSPTPIASPTEKVAEAPALSSSYETETVHYITLKFTQSSFTLDIGQHIKDHFNAFSITFPTTKKFYDSVSIGEELDSKFKTATFILSGHIGSRKVYVENKFTRQEGR